MGQVRFATIGTSGIAGQFLDALATLGDARLVGAYSRDVSRARAFGEPAGASLFFDDLDALASCEDIDAVYVASPNGLHVDQALRLVSAGKHVLVEKALAPNERQAARVFDAARSRGVIAMEAMRNLHVPTFAAIEREVAGLGPVREASLRFAKVTSRMGRLLAGERLNIFDPRLAGGALMDIGIYCVEPAVALFGRPERVLSLSVTSPVPGCAPDDPYDTIDLSGEALLGYADKVVSVSYGKTHDDALPSQIAGERATLLWDAISCPVNLRVLEHEDAGQVFRLEGAGEGRPVPVDVPERDMACEIADFVGAVSGDAQALEVVRRCERVTLDALSVMDEIRRQSGVRFPEDDL